jgi:hypothetical protein
VPTLQSLGIDAVEMPSLGMLDIDVVWSQCWRFCWCSCTIVCQTQHVGLAHLVSCAVPLAVDRALMVDHIC